MGDDECEEWPEATEATPKRVIRMRGRVRHVHRVEYDAVLAAEIGAMLDDDGDPERAR